MTRLSPTCLISDGPTVSRMVEGLDFKAPLKEYDMKMDKKGNAVIEFVARNPEDRYEFRAKVYTNGEASINVNMQNRQSISFQGELEMED